LKKYVIRKLSKELPVSLCYHNVNHTLEVIDTAEVFGRQEALSDIELCNVMTAALCHDTGFLYRHYNNEIFGMRFAGELLPLFNYDAQQITEIQAMILATSWPQQPKKLCEEILCDADLSYLGTDSVATGAENLRRELALNGKMFTDSEWLNLELSFLSQHHYFTRSAQLSREAGKKKYYHELQKQYNKMEK
jgi:predicted metal-dependent HD superfamily phosphohydrolase